MYAVVVDAMVEQGRLTEAQVAEAMQKASAMEGVRFSLMDDAQAAAEVALYLEAYNNDLVTFNGLVNKVKDVAGKYPNATWPERFLKENYEDDNEEDFINRLKWTISNYAVEEEKEYSAEKQTIEETFGGIWIDDPQEFVNFVSAVNTYPTDVNGEGIAKTSDYLYLYYRGIDERIIPFASVYLNKGESQNIANELINAWNNGENRTVREWIDWLDESYRNVNVQSDVLSGRDKSVPVAGQNGGVDSELSRKGRYYYTPELYSEVKRADSGSTRRGKVRNSLITPEMDASYLSAVERGDMEKAQQMVMEAAKLAMPNTKVVDENGNLNWSLSNYAIEEEKDYTKEKQKIEETFGGIWIDDTQEFAKFVSAVETYSKDRDGEGIAFTDNYFYAYYINTSNDAIPYAEVYLNGKDSQKYVDKIIKYGENRTAREWAYWVNENFGDAQNQNNDFNSGDQSATSPQEDGRVDSKLPRFGRYYYTPELYSKVKRADSGSTGRGKVRYYLSDAPTFYSNAEYAVRGIKQEKATPEQWLKMIEKAGGLKAGEDKWLGLSDWLKASDKKTLTKDEVLQYIADNNFVIEEVEYGETESFYSST